MVDNSLMPTLNRIIPLLVYRDIRVRTIFW
jgi:hypothetical protein